MDEEDDEDSFGNDDIVSIFHTPNAVGVVTANALREPRRH